MCFLFKEEQKDIILWVQHIGISLDTNFHLKQTILIFCTKLAQKEYFQTKSGQMGIFIEFWIFEIRKKLLS